MIIYQQDFTSGISESELKNIINGVLHNIASLRDHLKKWMRSQGRDAAKVDEAIQSCLPLSLIIDLWDREKHGGDRRDGGYSKVNPQLSNIHKSLHLSTDSNKGSRIVLKLGQDGVQGNRM